MSDSTRQERRLGWVTQNDQQFEAPKAADWQQAIAQQVCPFCGEGPFTIVAQHVWRRHGIKSVDLRKMLGVGRNESICDPGYSAFVSRSTMDKHSAGVLGPPGSEQAKLISARLRGRRSFRRGRKSPELHRPEQAPIEGVQHGLLKTYQYRGCRCRACRDANSAVYIQQRLDRRSRLSELPESAHGKASTYHNWMCRCEPCTDAWAAKNADYRGRRRSVTGRS